MKNQNRVLTACVFAFAAVTLCGAGLKSYTSYIVGKTKQEIQQDEQTKTDIKNQTLRYLTETHTNAEIEATLKEAFAQLDTQDCTEIVDTLIYATYSAAGQYSVSDEDTNTIYHAVDENDKIQYDLIEDAELLEMIEGLEEQNIILRYVNDDLFYDVNYGYFAETYKDYVYPDYYKMLSFYEEEKNISYCDDEEELLYTDVVEERLTELYKMITEAENADILYSMQDCYRFYKNIYLGAYGQDYIFYSGKVRENVYESYKKYMEETADEELKAFLEELVTDYDAVDLDRTVPIYERIKEFCEMSTAETETEAAEEEEETERVYDFDESEIIDQGYLDENGEWVQGDIFALKNNESESENESETETETENGDEEEDIGDIEDIEIAEVDDI